MGGRVRGAREKERGGVRELVREGSKGSERERERGEGE